MLGKEPWEYGNGLEAGRKETQNAYRAFRVYLELGSQRTAKQVAEIASESINNVHNWATRYNWTERSAYYDAHQVSLWGQQVKEEFETTHKEELLKFRKDQQRRAVSLGKVADLLIEVTSAKLEQMISEDDLIDSAQLAAVARTAGSLSEAAMNTAAAALGIDDLIEAINPEEQ